MRLSRTGFVIGLVGFVAVSLAVIGFFVVRAGAPRDAATPLTVAGGDADAGRRALQAYGCNACHAIPGMRSTRGRTAPELGRVRQRSYLAGRLPNTPDNLVRWIVSPQSIDPGTAMPDLGVREEEARHMAAYLYERGERR